MKKIGIYPGNFQPATRAHLEVYKRLKSLVGPDSFIATTDREPTPDAPLNFGDKQQIWVRHGVSAGQVVKISMLPSDNIERAMEWRPVEIFNNFSAEHIAAICVFNEKEVALFSKRKGKIGPSVDGMVAGTTGKIQRVVEALLKKKKKAKKERSPMIYKPTGFNVISKSTVDIKKQTEPRETESRETWLKPDGSLQYFQPYKGNENILKPFREHAYIIVLDDSRIQGNPVSTANIRSVLGSTKYTDDQKKKFFRWIFGWFDIGLYQLITLKFKMAHQVMSPEEEPSQPAMTDVGAETQIYPSKSFSPSEIYNSRRKLKEMVYEILEEIMDEDYSTTINEPDSSTTDKGTSGTSNGEKSSSQQRADATKQKQDLVAQKRQAERSLKGMTADLAWKKADVDRKRKDELPGKRKEIDDLNRQIAASSGAINV
jgi:hypothetical protein